MPHLINKREQSKFKQFYSNMDSNIEMHELNKIKKILEKLKTSLTFYFNKVQILLKQIK